MFLFSGGCPSAYIKQSLFIHSTSGNGGKPVKKIPASATVLPTMKVEVQSPYNRISISHNRNPSSSLVRIIVSFSHFNLRIFYPRFLSISWSRYLGIGFPDRRAMAICFWCSRLITDLRFLGLLFCWFRDVCLLLRASEIFSRFFFWLFTRPSTIS